MADLNMSVEALALRCMEKEIDIAEKVLAQRKIRLEIARYKQRITECESSVSTLDEHITQAREDLASLELAQKHAAQAQEVINNG